MIPLRSNKLLTLGPLVIVTTPLWSYPSWVAVADRFLSPSSGAVVVVEPSDGHGEDSGPEDALSNQEAPFWCRRGN